MTASESSSSNTSNRPKRAFCSHKPKWQRFQPTMLKVQTKKAEHKEKETYQYHRQYSHVYSQRLVALKPRCWQQFDQSKSNTYSRINRVLELREDVPSRLVGTLVKLGSSGDDDAPIQPESNCKPSDQLFLEDESGRVALKLDDVHHYCTGIVVGIEGKVDKAGVFHVEELVLPAPAPQPNLSSTSTMIPATLTTHSEVATTKSPHLLLVSSLLCGDPNVSSLPREMLAAYLQGQFTTDAAKVCRVLLVGGGPSSQDPLQGIKDLDAFCLQLTKAGIPIDIMPGKDDPTTANWPQRPLHSSLIPHATAIVSRTPNPYSAALGPQLVLATDGLNVRDLQKHTLVRSNKTTDEGTDSTTAEETEVLYEPCTELQALQRTLEWSHICPTGPDSVPTVPHMDQDPMVLDQLPHLYVSGNASEFATSTVISSGNSGSKTTLICVPPFSETGEAVLVNLETMGVELLRFEDQAV